MDGPPRAESRAGECSSACSSREGSFLNEDLSQIDTTQFRCYLEELKTVLHPITASAQRRLTSPHPQMDQEVPVFTRFWQLPPFKSVDLLRLAMRGLPLGMVGFALTFMPLLASCFPLENNQLPQDVLLVDDDLDGYSEDSLEAEGLQDCDDANANIFPGAEELCDGLDNNCDGAVDESFDSDEDGALDKTACANVGGTDCNDKDKNVVPGLRESCDNKDNNCNGTVDEGFDQDDDGFSSCDSAECDDSDPSRNEEEREVCDGVDNDCDDKIDEGFVDSNGTSSCVDDDGDGYSEDDGDCNDRDRNISPSAKESCDQKDNNCNDKIDEGFDQDEDGYKSCDGDCADTNDAIFPGASEACDALDNNCDGTIDEGYEDQDKDGFRNGCGDCDDQDASIRPGETDVCDGKDNNCDGKVDENDDLDGDGFASCTGDCDDANAAIYPTQAEQCNDIDDDCDGSSDEGFDQDGDTFKTCGSSPDCDNANASHYPGAAESCDARDNNCNGVADEGSDSDGDGFGDCAGIDCDDANAAVYPGQAETCNELDDDCDASIDEDFDLDVDGYASACGDQLDCDDSNDTINPGRSESCGDATDNDCDGQVDESEDVDKDGWTSCGTSGGKADCNDRDATVYPGAPEACNNRDNNCSGGSGDVYVTKDGTGDYTAIQTALSGTTSTCSIVVAPGTYKELLDFKGKSIYLRSEEGPNNTFLTPPTAGIGSIVTFKTSEQRGAILEGFTLQDGGGTSILLTTPPRTGTAGGAVYIYTASPTLRNNVFYSNRATLGGAVFAQLSSLMVDDNEFQGNTATDYAAAMFLDLCSNFIVRSNRFDQNSTSSSSSRGQGIFQSQFGSAGEISSNSFEGNETLHSGAVVLLGNTDVDVFGNYMTGNETELNGAGIVIGIGNAASIFDNEFSGNEAIEGGGALYCYGGTSPPYPTSHIFGNVFTQNDGVINGGGVYLNQNCSIDVYQNVFESNKATGGSGSALGGALLIQDSSARVYNNLFVANQGTKGGALAVKGASTSAVIANNTFYSNTAVTTASAIYLTDSTPLVINNLITFGMNGPMLFAESSGFTIADILYNDLYGNVSLTNISGLVGSQGNVSVDPLFIAAEEDNFRLKSGSPVINAGDPGSGYKDTDGSRNDMGAYGGPLGGW